MNKVSIILPVYNGKDYIDDCIKSLLKQTYKNIEIIFIDDGSTDNTKDIIESYQKKHKNIKYYYQKNNRQGAARNNGLSKATGDYILFIDSDDFIDKNMVKEMYEYASKGDYDIVLCDYYIHTNEKDKYIKCFSKEFVDYKNVQIKEFLLSTISPWNKIYKKDYLINSNFKYAEGIIYEDYASTPSLARNNPKIGYIPKAFVYYVQSENSTMRNDGYKDKFEDIFKATEFLYNSLKDKAEYKEELEYLIINHFLYNSSITFNNFHKSDLLLKINEFMKSYFPKWYKNKYFKEKDKKFKILCYLFYYNQTKLINLIRKSKKKYGSEKL